MALINAVVPCNTPKQPKLPSAEPDLGVFTGPINLGLGPLLLHSILQDAHRNVSFKERQVKDTSVSNMQIRRWPLADTTADGPESCTVRQSYTSIMVIQQLADSDYYSH